MPSGTIEPKQDYTQGFWEFQGVWIPNRGYVQVLEYAQAFGFPTGATYMHWDPKPQLHTGACSPNRGYIQVAKNTSTREARKMYQ